MRDIPISRDHPYIAKSNNGKKRNAVIPAAASPARWLTILPSRRRVERSRNYGGAVVGGLAGALVGNQVGNGHGREAATALGAVVGAFTGDRLGNRDRGDERYEQVQRQVQTCQVVNDVQQRLTGYQVAYEYRGQQFTTVLPENPGPNLQVRVSIDPVAR